jgi:hypothetical protein
MQIVQIEPKTTTNATVTVLYERAVSASTLFSMSGRIEGRKSDRTATFTCEFQCQFRRGASGSLALVGTPTITPLEDSSGTPAVTITVSSNNARINVTGVDLETWNWKAQDVILTRF